MLLIIHLFRHLLLVLLLTLLYGLLFGELLLWRTRLLLLQHHELLLLLEKGLELLLVQLVEELFAQNRHLNQVSWLNLVLLEHGGHLGLVGTDLLHGLLDLGGLGQLLLGEGGGVLDGWDAAFLFEGDLLSLGLLLSGEEASAWRYAEAGEHLRLLRNDHSVSVSHDLTQRAL